MLLSDAVNKEWKNANIINKIVWGKLIQSSREFWALKQNCLILIQIGKKPQRY